MRPIQALQSIAINFLSVIILFLVIVNQTNANTLLPTGPNATAIACMRLLPDGTYVKINRKPVTAHNYYQYIFIEEADRSAGIKVDVGPYSIPYYLQVGSLLTLYGYLDTVNGERIIRAASEIECDFSPVAEIQPYGMTIKSIVGNTINWLNEYPKGLFPEGLFVKICGVVTMPGVLLPDDTAYMYVDDGSGFYDGAHEGIKGIRIYSPFVLPDAGARVAVAGTVSRALHDPTPWGPEGDELVVPALYSTREQDIYEPIYLPGQNYKASVTGRVRLVNYSGPGIPVRIYSANSSIILPNVTDQWQYYALPNLSTNISAITASAPGYVSYTKCVAGGSSNVDFELEKSQTVISISSDKKILFVCKSEYATISIICHDIEGKGLPNKSIRLTTTSGVFMESGTNQAVLNTDSRGYISVRLQTGTSGEGIAKVTASTYPSADSSNSTEIIFKGRDIEITASPQYISQIGNSNITARLLEGDVPVTNAPVIFRTDFGRFTQNNSQVYQTTTNSLGYAYATLRLTAPGTATVRVSNQSSCGIPTFNWIAVAYKAMPWFNQSIQYSNPLVADLDGATDGKKEVVICTYDGQLVALRANGAVWWSQSVDVFGSNTPSCIPIDTERSAKPCIFIPMSKTTQVKAFSADGRPLAGWPANTKFPFERVAASISDINLDGSPEIVCGDTSCYVFSWNPTGEWKYPQTSQHDSYLWRNLTGSVSTVIYSSTCALGDIDFDANKIPDVVVGSYSPYHVYAFPGDAWGDHSSNPLYLPGWPKTINYHIRSSPAIGDIDGDGKNDVVIGCDENAPADGRLYFWLSSDNSWSYKSLGGSVASSPALFDLDSDGRLDIVVGSSSGHVYALNWKKEYLPGWEFGIRLNSTGFYAVEASPVLGDVTGDGIVDVVVGCTDGNLYAIHGDGRNHSENGIYTGPIAWVRCCIPANQNTAQILSAAAIDDIDNDGFVEIVAAGDKGMYMFHFDAPYLQVPSLFPWPTFHKNNQRTGCASQAQEPIYASIQGLVTKNGQPVTRAKVYIYYNDTGLPVPQPHSTQYRDYVQTVGDPSNPNQAGRGAYWINQLEPNTSYKLKVVADGEPDFWVNNIQVTTGIYRIDIILP